MAQYHSRLSDGSDQDDTTIETNLLILLQFLLSKGFIASFFATMWYHMDGFTNHYHCAYDVYLLSHIDL